MQRSVLAATLACSSILPSSQVLAQETAPAAAPTDVFQRAPPQVDEQLRKRVTGFLQAHVDGKFRAALDYIAEDTQDAYFTMEKKRYLSYEIVRIDYTDNFTKATVLSTVEVNWRASVRFPESRIKAPYKMLWKVENGDWYFYTVNTGTWETPFGTMRFPGANQTPQNDPAQQVINEIKNMDPKAILNKVRMDRNSVRLKAYEESTENVEITNDMAGPVTLKIEGSSVVGLEMKLDRTELKQGETARLTLHYVPPSKQARPDAVAVVRAEPLGMPLKIALSFALPPETEKALEQLKK